MDDAFGMERRLTAILSADVKGYSRLMGEDEVATVRTLTAYRELMASLIQQHRGRVVDTPGDNLLAELASVVDAVQCAAAIQSELKTRNAELPDHRKMEFRIGINLGDVVVEGERIYGDGVNIAARIEGLAEGGGICISGTAFDHVKKKLAIGYESLGEHAVKNIAEPVRVYRVLMEPEAAGRVIGETRPPIARMVLADIRARPWRWAALAVVVVLVAGVGAIWNSYLRPSPRLAEVASQEKMAFPLPEKPSVAVLPFENMTGDPEQDYFSDGITEGIITTLSKSSEMFVIARSSTFTYRGKPVTVQQVAEELGVRYVLEGSVQKADNRVRITAQLVDAITGNHVWAERYDRELKELFDLQDEITLEIVTALNVRLAEGEQARVWGKGTKNLEAWETLGRALKHFRRGGKEEKALARRLAEEAIRLDRGYAGAYVLLAWTYVLDAWYGWGESPAQSFERAVQLSQKALMLDDSLADVHALLGGIHLTRNQHAEAIAATERAIALNPNGADITAMLGRNLAYAGRAEEGQAMIKKAMRLSPFYPAWYALRLGQAYWLTGQYEEALVAFNEYRKRHPGGHRSYVWLAVIYSELGREEEARAEVAELLRRHPGFSPEILAKSNPFENQQVLERAVDALRKAGLK